MIWYLICRFCLGLAELALAIALFRGRLPRYLYSLLGFLFLSSIADLLPAHVWDGSWWREIFLPLGIGRALLAVAVSLQFTGELVKRISRSYGLLLVAVCWCFASALLWIAWSWKTTDWFQTVAVARQYGLMYMALYMALIWAVMIHLLPLPVEPKVKSLVGCWLVWLWAAFLLACTVRGGLMNEAIVRWTGEPMAWVVRNNGPYWRRLSEFALLVQITVLWRVWKIHRAIPEVLPGPEVRSSFLPDSSAAHSSVSIPTRLARY